MKHMKLHENQEFPLAFQKNRAVPSRVFVVKQSIPIPIAIPTPIWMKPRNPETLKPRNLETPKRCCGRPRRPPALCLARGDANGDEDPVPAFARAARRKLDNPQVGCYIQN
jgi:hypothetical protein